MAQLEKLYTGRRHSIVVLDAGNVEKFIRKLEGDQQAEVIALLKSCADDDPPTHNKQLCRSVGDGLFELKPGGIRILFFWNDGDLVLTNAFQKGPTKSQNEAVMRGKKLKRQFISSKERK